MFLINSSPIFSDCLPTPRGLFSKGNLRKRASSFISSCILGALSVIQEEARPSQEGISRSKLSILFLVSVLASLTFWLLEGANVTNSDDNKTSSVNTCDMKDLGLNSVYPCHSHVGKAGSCSGL